MQYIVYWESQSPGLWGGAQTTWHRAPAIAVKDVLWATGSLER